MVNLPEIQANVLQTIYEETGRSAARCVSLSFIEVSLGISAYQLRNILEDLKNERLIVEHQDGVRVTDSGLFESRTRWA